jgi:hypothetical protein
MVAAFCERLGWYDLEALIVKFQVGWAGGRGGVGGCAGWVSRVGWWVSRVGWWVSRVGG